MNSMTPILQCVGLLTSLKQSQFLDDWGVYIMKTERKKKRNLGQWNMVHLGEDNLWEIKLLSWDNKVHACQENA